MGQRSSTLSIEYSTPIRRTDRDHRDNSNRNGSTRNRSHGISVNIISVVLVLNIYCKFSLNKKICFTLYTVYGGLRREIETGQFGRESTKSIRTRFYDLYNETGSTRLLQTVDSRKHRLLRVSKKVINYW